MRTKPSIKGVNRRAIKQNQCGAFTLAEVLITLSIIGVVAALAIPGLITINKKKETSVKLLDTYNIITQAIKISQVDNGATENWNFNIASSNPNSMDNFFKIYMEPYLKIQKKCVGTQGCFSKEYNFLNGGNYNGFYDGTRGVAFILNNTTMVSLNNSNGPIWVMVDLDGEGGLNRVGRDVFLLGTITPEGFKVANQGVGRDWFFNETRWGCNKRGAGGESCAGLIQLDGWQIKDDYPW